MTAPTWLEHHLRTIGVADSAGLTGTFRTARPRPCRRCGTRILAGLDHDVTAFPAEADPTPLDETGELTALLTGRTTYSLDTKGHLWVREAHSIRAKWRGVVLPEHKCGQPMAAEMIVVKYTVPEEPAF